MLWLSNRRGSLLGTRGTTYPPIDDGWWPDVRAPNFEWDAFLRRFLIPYPHQVETRIEEKINNPRGCFGDEPFKNVKSFAFCFHCPSPPSRLGGDGTAAPGAGSPGAALVNLIFHLFARDELAQRLKNLEFPFKTESRRARDALQVLESFWMLTHHENTPFLLCVSVSKFIQSYQIAIVQHAKYEFSSFQIHISGAVHRTFSDKTGLVGFSSHDGGRCDEGSCKYATADSTHGQTPRKSRLTRAWGFATRRVCEVLSCSNAPGFPRGFHPLKFHIPHVVGRIQFSRDHHILCLTASRA